LSRSNVFLAFVITKTCCLEGLHPKDGQPDPTDAPLKPYVSHPRYSRIKLFLCQKCGSPRVM
jgi:hypothetical protein